MKTYLQIWWRGIGVCGLYIGLSFVIGLVSLLVEALPGRLQLAVGLPFSVLVVPPLLFWSFRWLYPEVAAGKSRFSKDSPVS